MHDVSEATTGGNVVIETAPDHENVKHQSIRAVDRAIRILSVLAANDAPQTLTEIARASDLNPASALRMLRTLHAQNLVQVTPAGDRYLLGFRILEFSQALLRQLDIVALARPIIRAVRDEWDETTGIGMRTGDFWVHVVEVESALAIRRVSNLSERLPLYAGSTGKVFLAAMTDKEFEHYLERTPLIPLSPTTPADPGALRDEIALVRERGYAVSRNERGEGAAGIAAPIYGHDDQVIAALTISGPVTRFSGERFEACIATVVRASTQLSEALGYRPDTFKSTSTLG